MNKLLPLVLLSLFSLSCKKAIDKKIESVLMSAITSGTWYIEQYKESGSDITGSFSEFEFRFHRDGTLEGIRTGSDPATGTWQGNLQNASINTLFPAAIDPLKKVNGLWKITDSYMDYVEAEMSINGGKNILHLRKK